MNGELRVAEYVFPGHPDKLADRIADEIVDLALAADPEAAAAIEVALDGRRVFVDGRLEAGESGVPEDQIRAAVGRAFGAVGFGERWEPSPETLDITLHVASGGLSPEHRAVRASAEDQAIVTGYATGDETNHFLPLEHYLAHRLARRLWRLRDERPDLPLGPDGKLMLCLEEEGGSWVPTLLNLSLQHGPGIDWVSLARSVRETVLEEMAGVEGATGLEAAAGFEAVAGLGAVPRRAGPNSRFRVDEGRLRILLNPSGSFCVGGPLGDNGLTGRKLVVDFYGPSVPIGGGALSGKDPRKVDRLGALRARQIARAAVETGLAESAFVRLGYLPGQPEPELFEMSVDGVSLAAAAAARWRGRFDLSIEGTVRDLRLAEIEYAPLASWGHFTGGGVGWEGGAGASPSARG